MGLDDNQGTFNKGSWEIMNPIYQNNHGTHDLQPPKVCKSNQLIGLQQESSKLEWKSVNNKDGRSK